ncbi:MAG: hypothetical protein NT069_35910, partial [Planctomycetota bacterium]|nr:hypothetical protein [Planctomycetota bacterium]
VAVAEAPLTNTTPVNTLFAVKGVSTSTVTLATFTDGNPLAPAADFKYTVNWGGALSGAATTSLKLVSRSTTSSTWSIVGSANYLSRGVYTVGVTVNDVDGASFSTNNTKISVANGKITDISVATTYTTVEGNSTGLQTLATFTDSNPNAQYADFDGISSAFTGALVNEGVFLELVSRTATLSTWRLVGSAVYVMPGVFTVGVITSEINGPKVPFAKAKFKVVDADLTDTSISQLLDATEGVDTGDVVLATFSDANPLAKVTDFTLSVTWGKLATPTSADASIQLVSRSATSSNWKVVGHAAYANKGLAGPTVKISDVLGESLVSAKTKFSVQDAPLTDVTTPATVDVIEGSSTGIVTLATFSDANPYAPLTDFKATVSWGGTVVGTPSVKVALVERGPTSSTWVVTGSVVYRTAGLYTPRVGIKDVDGSFLSSGQTTLKVADAPLTDTTVTKILTATEAKSTGQITLATFTDGNPQALAADFDVSVNWGGAVTITPLVSVVLVSRTTTSSNWAVKGSTIFRDAGVHTIAVHVAETSGSTLDTDHVSVNVADAPLTDTTTSRTVSALHGVSTADLTLARFTDATPTSRSTDFSVSVDWGGTTTSSDFQLVQEGSSFSSVFWKIVGHVTYATAGTYTVTVTINDVDGATLVSKRTKFKVT